MKKVLSICFALLIVNAVFTQPLYTFTGNGNWSTPANWLNGTVPPIILPAGSTIIISPSGTDECILDRVQTIATGATLTVPPGKKFTVSGSLIMAPAHPVYTLHGLCFSPYYEGQSPDWGSVISEPQINYLLHRVATYTNWVRSYGCTHGLEKIGINAHNLGLQVAAGAWLDENLANNQIEINNLIELGQAGEIDVAIVGSEVLLRNDLTKAQLIGYIDQVRAALPNIPVTTADVYQTFLNNPDLVDTVDVLYVHIYPFWEGKSLDCAVNFIDNVYTNLLAVGQGKEIVVAETGWPSEGDPLGRAVPSPENAAAYFLNFVSWAKIKQVKYFYFEAFDEPWKMLHEPTRGGHWGIWRKDGGPMKPYMDSVFNGVTRPNNWALDTAAILAQTPSIEFTHIPPLGSFENLEGITEGVFPTEYRIVVYIYVGGGWWTKPGFTNPYTSIQCDGTFICDITTGGIDEQATKIRACLVPKTYSPPLLGGNATIPPEVEQNAVACVEVSR
jgi:exo-beta-1,3-glucanase (GH17 family)